MLIRLLKKYYTLILIPTFFVVLLSKYSGYGVTFDEFDQIELGKQAIKYYFGGLDKSFLTSHFASFFFTTRGAFPEVFIQLIRKTIGTDSLESYHFLLGVINSVSYLFVYLSVLTLTKSKFFSLLAALGLYFFPRFSGDIFNNSKDTPAGMILSVFIYFSLKYFLSPKGINKFLTASALILGLLVSIRVVLVYLLPILLVLIFLKNKRNINDFIRNASSSIIYFLLPLYIFNPYLHAHPILGLYKMIKDSISYPDIGLTFFEGNRIMSNEIPKYYLVKYIFISIPEYLLAIMLVVNIYLIFAYIYKSWFYRKQNIFHLMVFLDVVIFVPTIMTLMFNPSLYDGWRHFIFLAVPIVMFSFAGLFFISQNFKRFSKAIILIVIVAFVQIFSKINYLYPYEYMYFNSFAGSFKNASENYETDYWGKSFRESALWINANYGYIGRLPVFSCVEHLSKPYLSSDLKLVSTKPDVPFIYVCFTRLGGNIRYGGEVLFAVERFGVTLNEVRIIK